MFQLNFRSPAGLLVAAGALGTGAQACPQVTSNFAFGSGTPFAGSTDVGGVGVTITSTNTEPFGATSFRDTLGSDPATVLMTFDRPIVEFSLSVSFVRFDEYLTGFNLGLPTSLSGSLIEVGGLITVPPAVQDSGAGTLTWTGINTTEVSFTVDDTGALPFGALAVNRFSIIPLFSRPYCGPAPINSTGASALIRATGSGLLAQNDLTLVATDLPPSVFGFFLASQTEGFTPNPGGSSGNLCLAGAIGRFSLPAQILDSGAAGTFSLAVDQTAVPQGAQLVPVMSGETWNYQAWFRDSVSPGFSNFTDAVSVLGL